MNQRHKETPMNLPEQTLGDCIDKMTILCRKVYFGEEEAYEELKAISGGLVDAGYDGELLLATARLAMINGEIWNLENCIRKGGEGKLGLEEVGRRSILIRDLNRKRIKYKNHINELTGGFKEVKVNHASQ